MICNSLWICYKQIWQRISKQSTEHFLTVEIKKLEPVTVLISYKLKPRAFYCFYLKYLIWFFSNYSKVFLTCSRHKISTSWNTSSPKLRSKCTLTSYHLILVTVHQIIWCSSLHQIHRTMPLYQHWSLCLLNFKC